MTKDISAVIGGRVLVDDRFVKADLYLDGPVIGGVRIDPSSSALRGSAASAIDAAGMLVTPGLIDVHIHGARGQGLAGANPAGLAEIGRYLIGEGVTSYVASLASATTDELELAISRLARHEGALDEARLLGVHLEGPFLSPAQRGAHAVGALRSPSPADVALIRRWSHLIRMVTMAPEVDGVLELTPELVEEHDIVVAAGHSDDDGEGLVGMRAAGASHITHLWSGQSQLRREGPWRVPGMLEASLASTGMTAEIIADGRHLPSELLEIARRCLGDRLVIVSDATPGTGMPDGYRYRLGAVECVVRDGVGVVVGQDSFGGSTTLLPDMVRYLVGELGWDPAETFRMATTNAARAIGVSDRHGTIGAGMSADLVVWDSRLRPAVVVRGGRRVL